MMRRFARDAFLYALPNFAARVVGLILLPIYARHLGPQDLGFIEYVSAFSTFALLLIPLEINQAMARLLSEGNCIERQRSLIYTAITFTTLSLASAGVIIFLLKSQILNLAGIPESYLRYTLLVLIHILGLAWVGCLQIQFRFMDNPKASILLNLFTIFANFSSIMIFSINHLSLDDYFISSMITNLSGALIGFYVIFKKFGTPSDVIDRKTLSEMLRYSLPILLSSFGVALSVGLDRILIGRFAGLDELGFYGVAARFGGVAAIAFSVASSAITPIVYRHHEDVATKRLISRIFYITIALCLIAMSLLTFFSEDLVVLFAGEGFRNAAPLVFFIFAIGCLSNLYIFFLGMDIAKDTPRIAKINASMGAFGAAMSVALIPVLGVWGAIISGAAAACLKLSLYIYSSQKLYPVTIRVGPPFFVIFCLMAYNALVVVRGG